MSTLRSLFERISSARDSRKSRRQRSRTRRMTFESLEDRRMMAFDGFADPVLISNDGQPAPSHVAVGDLNGDGDEDLIAVTKSQNIHYFENPGNGAFKQIPTVQLRADQSNPHEIQLKDVNNDHRLDVVFVNNTRIGIFLNHGNDANGNAQFSDITSSASIQRNLPFAFGDFDGDDNLDLVTGDIDGDAAVVKFWRNAGDGTTFSETQSVEVGNNSALDLASFVVGDVTGDGQVDVALATARNHANDNSVLWVFAGNGNGLFTAEQRGAIEGHRELHLSDLNEDNQLDLIVADDDNDRLVVRLNEGTGQFGTSSFVDVGDNPVALDVADVDADGHLDVVTADHGPSFGKTSATGDRITLLKGRGDGSFENGVQFLAGDPDLDGIQPSDVTLADLDGNGFLDAVVGHDQVTLTPFLNQSTDISILYGKGTVDVNQPPTVSLANVVTSLPEDTDTSSPVKVANIIVTDDDLGTNNLSLEGGDKALFAIAGNELRLKAGATLDFETNPSLDVTVVVDDPAVGNTPDDTASLSVKINDVNELPSVSLSNTVTTLREDIDTSSAIRVADIAVHDDALGTNNLYLAGDDASLFEILNNELRLQAGTTLDFETNPSLEVTVAVDDSTIGSTPDGSISLVVSVLDVAGPEILVGGRNLTSPSSFPEILDGDTTPSRNDSTDFGSANLDGETVAHTFLLGNVGDADLRLNGDPAVQITGPHVGDFTVIRQPHSTVIPHEGVVAFEILFDPAAPGLRTAAVQIANNDSDENLFDFVIQGFGVPDTFTVDSFEDTVDANPGDGFAVDVDGKTSLRAAIQEANALPGDQTVFVPAGTYKLALPLPEDPHDDTDATADLDITDTTGKLTVLGAGAGETVIDADDIDNVFLIHRSAAAEIDGVTVTGGYRVAGSSGALLGGGFFNAGSLVLKNSIITGNTADRGGGLSNWRDANLTIVNSTIYGNRAVDDLWAVGGGIFNSGGEVAVINSTISLNQADRHGGGVYNNGTLRLVNATVTANAANEDGGGISAEWAVQTTASNSIMAGNFAIGTDADVKGSFVSMGHNLIGDVGSATGFTHGANGDLVGGGGNTAVDPKLGPLQNNGGFTLTHALLLGSPAIDAGQTSTETDQRGQRRPVDIAEIPNAGDGSDIGAFEATPLVISYHRAQVFGFAPSNEFEFVAGATHEVKINGETYRLAEDIREIYFYGGAGDDEIRLTASGDNEVAKLRPGSLEVSGPNYQVHARDVEQTWVDAGGGYDRAYLYDSVGNDWLVSTPSYSYLAGAGFRNYAQGFERVYAYASTGNYDRAYLYDSAGNDTFVAGPQYSYLYGAGYLNFARGFDRVYAYATAGGHDRAYLYDSAGDDTFVATPTYSYMYGSGFFNYARGFNQVSGYATAGGNDRAYMYDSAGDDTFYGRRNLGILFGDGFYNQASGFEQLSAVAFRGGNDVIDIEALDYIFREYGSWNRKDKSTHSYG